MPSFSRFLAPFKRSSRRTPSPSPAPAAAPQAPSPPTPPSPTFNAAPGVPTIQPTAQPQAQPQAQAPVSAPVEPHPPELDPPPVKRDVFRITEIPLSTTLAELTAILSATYSPEKITVDESQTMLCLSPDHKTQTALVQFQPRTPSSLARLSRKDFSRIELGDAEIIVDKDFYGLTPMYPTTGSEIKADIVAVCGLNGHAYGSWAGKPDKNGRRKMWLRHFLAKDLPQCRTMTYGYDSSLGPENKGMHTIPDYSNTFLEGLKQARSSNEEKERPIIFIGHSFGGIIIVQTIVKAKDNENIHGSLFSRTRATMFFGTPHRGMLVDDILAMIGQSSQRIPLVRSLETGSPVLKRELESFINYSAIIKSKIITFKEGEQTRRLMKSPVDGKWSRSGEYFTAVETESSVLQLPNSMEESLLVDGDHSTMVKFEKMGDSTYKTVCRYLESFTSYSTPPVVKIAGLMTAYKAVKSMSAPDLKLALEQPRVDLNEIHEGRTTLLHMAITNNDKVSTEMLLNHGANIDILDRGGSTPLHQAVREGNPWAIDMLLDNGANLAATSLGMTALHIAAKAGDQKMAGLLLDRKSDIEAISSDTEGFTALQFAAQSGHVDMLAMLLERGAAINAIGHDGDTPLHAATWQGHEKAVQLLLDKGADMRIAERNGCTVLHFAAFQGRRGVLEILLRHGADMTIRDSSERTVLHVAALSGHIDIIEALLKANADLTSVTVNGHTALHVAARNGKDAVVGVLLKNGADIAAVDKAGNTALQLALDGEYEKVVEALRSWQMHVDETGDRDSGCEDS